MIRKTLIATALAAALLPAAADAARRPDMKSCGDTTAGNGLLIGDVTARRVSCKRARRIARAVPARCGNNGNCTVRGYTCFTAPAAEELRFARCTKAGENDELFRTIRFDFGS
jgi:hypothetical protein